MVYNASNVPKWSSGTNENFGAETLRCGFDANRGADIRVRKPPAGTTANDRARRVIEWGAWDWNAASGSQPHFVQIDPGPTTAEVETTTDTDPDKWGGVVGASTNACPVQGSLQLRVYTNNVTTEARARVTGPHEFGHILGLPHRPENPTCGGMQVMYPSGADLVACDRHQPTTADIAQILWIYN